MARKRRTSAVLETARQRLAGLKQINPVRDFGATQLSRRLGSNHRLRRRTRQL